MLRQIAETIWCKIINKKMFFYATVKLWKCSGFIAATLYISSDISINPHRVNMCTNWIALPSYTITILLKINILLKGTTNYWLLGWKLNCTRLELTLLDTLEGLTVTQTVKENVWVPPGYIVKKAGWSPGSSMSSELQRDTVKNRSVLPQKNPDMSAKLVAFAWYGTLFSL